MNAVACLPDGSLAPSSVTAATFPSMPEDYRRAVIRTMSIQAYAEKLGAIGVPGWTRKVPDYRTVRTVARILAEEARHAYLLYRQLETIGVSEAEAINIATAPGSASASLEGPASLENPELGWQEIVMNHMFLDRAGKYMVGNFTMSSFAPWAEACRKIIEDEAMHIAFGESRFRNYVRAHADDPALPGVVTHWFCQGLNFFGPPPSARQSQMAEWGLKRKDNDTLREEYRAEVMALLEEMGLAELIQIANNAYPYS
jgi:1,2-phenylacetyl-CoA epoxidase catalytic subunit